MKGTILTISPDGERNAKPVDGPPTLEMLKDAIGGGYAEMVPGFTNIRYNGKLHGCVALVDEDGKRKQMPINRDATALWDEALKRNGHPGLITPDRKVADHIVGRIAIFMGDQEFMESL